MSNTQAMLYSMLLAAAFVPMQVNAEGGGQLAIPVAFAISVAEPSLPTCDEAANDAWFEAQLKLTDGDVTPVPNAPGRCKREMRVAETE